MFGIIISFIKRRCLIRIIQCRNMSSVSHSDIIFAQKFNPISGQVEWEPQDHNFDYHQEIARSAYADMLHDTERNRLYEAGLRWAIGKLRTEGRPVRVLDIGTGTGLLAMFACRLGADQVTACEAFPPVASCARGIMRQNGFGDQIRLISKRSTELKVGPGCDIEERATILVTEVFDTELIGEGAISTFNHAHEHLLEKGCLVIPSRAKVYCQIVESKQLRNCHQHKPVQISGYKDIVPPAEANLCHGSAAVLDIQMSRLHPESFKLLTDPFEVCSFDFSGLKGKIPNNDSCRTNVSVNRSGRCDALLFWWDIDMGGGEVLSCAPHWNHPKGRNQPWRDHWMQAVYFPLRAVETTEGENLSVACFHDEYSFWFDVQENGSQNVSVEELSRRPVCTCGLHMVCNPQRISLLNDSHITNQQIQVLKKSIEAETVCVSIGNGCSILPLLAARLGAKKVYVIDTSRLSSQVLNRYIEENELQSKVTIISKSCDGLCDEDFNGDKIDVVLSEPYFICSYLPWHDITLWYSVNSLGRFLKPNHKVIPARCEFWAVGMDFAHLWKIRAPLGNVEGFDMTSFDQLVQNSSTVADPPVEPHSLWEYEGMALTEPFQLFKLDMTSSIDDLKTTVSSVGSVPFKRSGVCNGIAIWAEWFLDDDSKCVRGPIKPVVCGEKVTWDFNSKQGVYFFSPKSVTAKNDLNYCINFVPQTFEYNLHFDISK